MSTKSWAFIAAGAATGISACFIGAYAIIVAFIAFSAAGSVQE